MATLRALTGRLHGGRATWLPPLGSGLLLVLAFPPAELLVPSFIALVPFLLLIAELPAGSAGRWTAARAGYLMGVVYFGLLLYWLLVALIFYTPLAVLAYVLTVLVLAGFTGAFGAALHYVRDRTPVPLALSAALLWTALEWLQGHLGDLSFPWLGLGTSLAAFPRVAGAAELVGARGLTFWLALVNGLLAMVILAVRGGRPARRLAGATAVVVAIPVLFGIWRAETLELRPAARVAVVQPNIPEDLKMQRIQAIDSSLTALSNLMARIPPETVDLVAWPEMSLPARLTYRAEAFLQEPIRRLSAAVGAPIVVGAYGLDIEGGAATLYNSAFVLDAGGLTGQAYDKKYLVPFVERVPFIDPAWLEKITGNLQYFGGLGRGTGAPVFGPEMARYGVLICYESVFARHARAYRLAGADYLVNMTNDAWYGREPWYTRTSALWQHPSHLVMRAIEARVGIARAANTGISMFVDPLGNTYERTELFEPAVRVGTIYTTDVVTLYARWGDWLANGATLAAVLLLVAARVAPRSGVGARAGAGAGAGERTGAGAEMPAGAGTEG